MIYGYCRISTAKQNIERQVNNILREYPEAIIIREVFTGTKFQGRKELERLLKTVKPDDTLVFDEVSRMSRNAEEGYALYEELYSKGVNLVFLKEPHINSDTYRHAISNGIPMTDTNIDYILQGVNQYLMALAKEQIRLAFVQSQKEVEYLHQRTKEGIARAKTDGKRIGTEKGRKLTTKKSVTAKELIRKHNIHFGGSLNNEDTYKLIGINRNTFYKYLREMQESE